MHPIYPVTLNKMQYSTGNSIIIGDEKCLYYLAQINVKFSMKNYPDKTED